MKKHLGEWVLAILSIVGMVVLLSIGKGQGERYERLVVDRGEWSEIMGARERTSDMLVSKVSFDGQELLTADGGREWYYSMVEGSDTAKNPEVKYRTDSGAKLAILEGKITDGALRSGEAIEVMAYDGSRYSIYELFVTTLPVMSINHSGAIDMSKADGEETMQLRMFDNRAGATQRLVMTDGKIKVRGASTADYPKKGFRMKLRTTSVGENKRPNSLSLLGMRQDDDWLLYAGYDDEEKIRNVFATNLWKEGQAKNNEFKIDNGVEYKYIELLVNDSYYGLYALGYPVDDLVLQLKMGSNGFYDEFSFKKVSWDEEYENILNSYELKTNVKNPAEAWSELDDYNNLITSGDSTSAIRRAVDMRNAIDYSLFVEFIQGSDNDYKNLYLTAKDWDNMKVWIYTPWDLDLIFGRTGNGEETSRIIGVVVGRLQKLGDGEIGEEVAKRYKELREKYWSDEHISELINEYEREIYRSGAFSRDMARWPEGNYNDPDEELIRFKEYVLKRLEAMDELYL